MRLLALCMLLSVSVARGSVIYEFDYSPFSGPVKAFSFQFESPTFVGVGPISFDPFTFTDGTTTWTMTRGVAGENYVSMCFLFAAAGPTSEISEQCSASTGPPDGATFFTSFTNYPAPILPPPRLPSSPGIYRTPFGGFSVYMGDPPGISSTGTVTLTVSGTSAVPEPAAFPLIAAGLVALLAFRPWRSIRKRSAEP